MTATSTRPARSVEVELALAQARDDARAGDLPQARQRLDQLDDTDAEVLDLRARVLAQNGDLDGADREWQRLKDAEPGHPAAAAGSRAVADVRNGRRHRRALAAALGTALVATVMATVPILLTIGHTASEAPVTTPVTAPVTDTPPRTAAAPTEDAPTEDAPTPTGPTTTTAPPLDPNAAALAAALSGPEIHARTNDSAIAIRFNQGLFVRGIELSSAGRGLLNALAPRLTRQVEQVEVVGHSVVVPGGPSTGGSTVALARAQHAAVILARSGPLPLTAYTVRPAEQTQATGKDAAQARTVTLRLVLQDDK